MVSTLNIFHTLTLAHFLTTLIDPARPLQTVVHLNCTVIKAPNIVLISPFHYQIDSKTDYI